MNSSVFKISIGFIIPALLFLSLPQILGPEGNSVFEKYVLLIITATLLCFFDLGASRSLFLALSSKQILLYSSTLFWLVLFFSLAFVPLALAGSYYYLRYLDQTVIPFFYATFFLFTFLIMNLVKNIFDGVGHYLLGAILRLGSISIPLVFVIIMGLSDTSIFLASCSNIILATILVVILLRDKEILSGYIETGYRFDKNTFIKNAFLLFAISLSIFFANYYDKIYLSSRLEPVELARFVYVSELFMKMLVVSTVLNTFLIGHFHNSNSINFFGALKTSLILNAIIIILGCFALVTFLNFTLKESFLTLGTEFFIVMTFVILANSTATFMSSLLEVNEAQFSRLKIFTCSSLFSIALLHIFQPITFTTIAWFSLGKSCVELVLFSITLYKRSIIKSNITKKLHLYDR